MTPPWVAFGLGVVVGANAGLLLFGLLAAASGPDPDPVWQAKMDAINDAEAEAEAMALWAEAGGHHG
jgi:hypothetical protein